MQQVLELAMPSGRPRTCLKLPMCRKRPACTRNTILPARPLRGCRYGSGGARRPSLAISQSCECWRCAQCCSGSRPSRARGRPGSPARHHAALHRQQGLHCGGRGCWGPPARHRATAISLWGPVQHGRETRSPHLFQGGVGGPGGLDGNEEGRRRRRSTHLSA